VLAIGLFLIAGLVLLAPDDLLDKPVWAHFSGQLGSAVQAGK
jgi:hypothetical protein